MKDFIKEAIITMAKVSSKIENLSGNLSTLSKESEDQSNFLIRETTEMEDETRNINKAIEKLQKDIENVADNSVFLASSSRKLFTEAENAEIEAEKGKGKIENTLKVIIDSSEKSKTASQVVSELARNTKNVEEILEAISSISDQTNLLALNAAIEAARAGEAGKGFAVVADEIRKLAEESKSATSRIGAILKEIQKGTIYADKVSALTVENIELVSLNTKELSDNFLQLITQSREISKIVSELDATSQKQKENSISMEGNMNISSQSIFNIAKEVEKIASRISKQTDKVKEIDTNLEELKKLSILLLGKVKIFKV